MNRPLSALALLALCFSACSNDVEPLTPDDPLCDEFNNHTAVPAPVTILIRNDGSEPIYLGSATGGCSRYIDMLLSRDDENVPFRTDTSCTGTCELLRQGDPACTDECAVPPLVYIEPGGVYEETWAGTVFERRDMPEGCYANSEYADNGCQQIVVAPTADYTFTVSAWNDIADCTEPETCECTPDVSGSCAMYNFVTPSGTPRQASASFRYPDAATIEISVP